MVQARVARFVIVACAALPILIACSGGPQGFLGPMVLRQQKPLAVHLAHGYVYVSNRTRDGASELLVYPEGVPDPHPVRIVRKNIAQIGGITVDAAGDVYVANGSAGNVLEFAPGASSLIRTYSNGLEHPISVSVFDRLLYVSDQAGQVVEYAIGKEKPLAAIDGPGFYSEPNAGIVFAPPGSVGPFFASASSLTAIPFAGKCNGSIYQVAEFVLSTLWLNIPLSNNRQVGGLAFDGTGNLYVADPCAHDVAIYSEIDYTYSYVGKVPGTFESPLFLTINRQMLAVPNDGTRSQSGTVTIIDLNGHKPTVTISNGVEHPVGAAVTLGA
jgi:hypothetical protein